MPITFGTLNDLSPLEARKVENGLEFSDFITIAYYINFGGPVPLFYEAHRSPTYIAILRVPIGTTNKIFI